jgi:predicted XRE-type DNA-binding protein
MKIDQKSGDLKCQHVTSGDGNVFEDLGFAPKKADALLRSAQARVTAAQRLKQEAAQQIADWIATEELTQVAASKILAVSRPRVSDLINSKLTRFSLDTLISMLLRVGKTVEIVVGNRAVQTPRTKQSPSRRAAGA